MSEENLLREVSKDSVSLTEWFTLAWALVWRGIILSLGSMIIGGIVGGLLGLIMGILAGILGIDAETIRPVVVVLSGVVGLFIGLYFVIILIKWTFKAKFRNFRLTLVKPEEVIS